jgi:hypothetical protein
LNPRPQYRKLSLSQLLKLASKMHCDYTIIVPGRSLVYSLCIYKNLAGITVKSRYRILGILGHSLRNKIPIVGNQGESEVCSMEEWDQTIYYIP